MDDSIFDDVDAILNEDVSSEENSGENSSEEKSFNDSELQDIMSEIENLEKEFVSEPAPTMSLQDQIDAELAAELDEINGAEVPDAETAELEEMEEMEAMIMDTPVAIAPAPVEMKTFSKPVAAPSPKSENKSEVSFQAHGQMSFNLDFKVGEEIAKLSVDPVKGLMVTVAGVEMCINEDSGCTVSMENGMKFTIPLSSQANSHKKKAA